MRYHLGNDTKFIEFPFTKQGLRDAKKYRKEHSEFKYRRIQEVFQALPGTVELCKEYQYTYGRSI